MTKRLSWKPGGLINIKLREDLYTIGHMLVSPVLLLYDISKADGAWDLTDFAGIRPLFQVLVGRVVLSNLAVDKVIANSLNTSPVNIERHWIKPHLCFDGTFPFKGGKLIDAGAEGGFDTTNGVVVKHQLRLPEDRLAIEKTELTNMWGDKDLGDRLRRYFDTGVDRDDLKFEIFPGLWDDREDLRPLTRRLPQPSR